MAIYRKFGKRLVDLLVAVPVASVAAPIIAAGVCAVKLSSPGPAFFTQERIGYRGRSFTVWKLRTMVVNRQDPDQLGQVTGDSPLVTPAGRWLRRFKVDELPQVWNVLSGDMSLVGPRPTIPAQVERYTAWERRRLDVQPGMTGWAQVNGNTTLSWEDRIALDIWYGENVSLWLDLEILARTVGVVLWGERPNTQVVNEIRTRWSG